MWILKCYCCILAIILFCSSIYPAAAQEAFVCDSACQERIKASFLAAEALESEGKLEEAVEQYSAVIAEQPLSTQAQQAANLAGQVLHKSGQYLEAINFFNQAISIADTRSTEPNPAESESLRANKREALYRRPQALEKVERYTEALDDYAAFLVEEPLSSSSQHAAVRAGQIFEQMERLPEAAASYEKVISVADAHLGEQDEAKALIYRNWKRDALLKQADACRRAGLTNDARGAIERLRAEFPVSLQTAQAGVIEAQLNQQNTQAAEIQVANELQAQRILDEAIRLSEVVVGGVDLIRPVACPAGAGGIIFVQFKIKAGKNDETFWNIWIDDPSGKNLARWYGSGTIVRGRIGTTSTVTEQKVTLTGNWDELKVEIRLYSDQSEFFFNDQSLGVLDHSGISAGDALGRIRFERIRNPAAEGGSLQIDDLTISPGGFSCFEESFAYSDGPLNRAGGWTGSAENEIEVVDGTVYFNGGEHSRYKQSIALLDQVRATFPDTGIAIVALEKKARILANLKRMDEAKTCFKAVLDTLRPTASGSEFFQSARIRLKRYFSEDLFEKAGSGQPILNEDWAALESVSSEIATQDNRVDERANARITRAVALMWQHKDEEAVLVLEELISDLGSNQLPDQLASAHLMAGGALQKIGDYARASEHLNWLIQNPDLTPDSVIGKKTLPNAYIRLWFGLKRSGASQEVLNGIREEFASKFPDEVDKTLPPVATSPAE